MSSLLASVVAEVDSVSPKIKAPKVARRVRKASKELANENGETVAKSAGVTKVKRVRVPKLVQEAGVQDAIAFISTIKSASWRKYKTLTLDALNRYSQKDVTEDVQLTQ